MYRKRKQSYVFNSKNVVIKINISVKNKGGKVTGKFIKTTSFWNPSRILRGLLQFIDLYKRKEILLLHY